MQQPTTTTTEVKCTLDATFQLGHAGRRMVEPIEDVVARNLALYRELRGFSQESVARAMQEIGLAWTRGTVAAIEGGSRRISLGELLTLTWALGATVEDLVTPHSDDGEPLASWIELSPGLQARRVASLLHGELAPKDVRQRDAPAQAGQPDLADRLAAQKLEISVDEVAARARKLWGMSLTDKRDEVLTQRLRKDGLNAHDEASRAPLLQALRGHITRELYRALDRAGSTRSRVPNRVPAAVSRKYPRR